MKRYQLWKTGPSRDTCPPLLNSIFLTPCTPVEVEKLAEGIKSDCAVRPDLIPARVIKESIQLTSNFLSDNINKCFESGVFPVQLKCARIRPVFKSKDDK